jgi:hypothetical protein
LDQQAHDETLVQTPVRNLRRKTQPNNNNSIGGSRPNPLESHGIEAEKGEEMGRRLTRSSESCSVISASFVF